MKTYSVRWTEYHKKEVLAPDRETAKEIAMDSVSELERYKKAYNILMDFFDDLHDDDKAYLDEQLSEVGL